MKKIVVEEDPTIIQDYSENILEQSGELPLRYLNLEVIENRDDEKHLARKYSFYKENNVSLRARRSSRTILMT